MATKGRWRSRAVVLPGGIPGPNRVDHEGEARIVIHTGTDGEPHLKLLGKDRALLFDAPTVARRPPAR